MDPAELGEAERLVWKAFPRGAWVDLSGTRRARPVIRAEVVAALLLGAVGAEPGGAAGIRLRGATVAGRLDFTGGAVAWPAVFDDCEFGEAPCLADSSMRTVRILDSELPGFDGTLLRLDGVLDLTNSTITGAVRLEQARLNGHLRLRGIRAGAASPSTTPASPKTDRTAVLAAGLSVTGEADCAGMEARGLVSFEDAAVTGSLNLAGTRISCPGRRGLDLNHAAIGGTLACRDIAVEGGTRASNCRIGVELLMSGARLANPGGAALIANGADVTGGAFLDKGFSAQGEVSLVGARLAANLSVTGSTFDNPGDIAVNLGRASIGDLNAHGVSCRGQLNMAGATVAGDVHLPGAVLETGNGKPALNAERARIDGTLSLRAAKAFGEVNLRSIRLGERLLLTGAELRDPHGMACRLSRAQVTADMYCDQVTIEGRLRVSGATIGASLSLDESELSWPAGTAVDAKNLRVRQLRLRPKSTSGLVDLSHATVGVLLDEPAAWPERLYLDGLTYQSLEPPLPAGRRLRWLARDPRGHQPQPYEQLAAHYNAIGQPVQARHVLYAREKIQHQGRGPASAVLGLVQDITVGYGYRPRRALGWLALLVVTGSIVFSVAPPPALQTGAAPHFNGIVYTLDLLLPVVNLGQKYAFNPGGAEQWLSYFLMAAGWILATTVAAGAARILRRG